MTRIAVVYYSSTGNTQAMAEEIARGARDNGGDVTLIDVGSITPDEVLEFDVIALGCAAYGNEVLEEYEFQPFYDELEPHLTGKRVALFGSYDWGDGQWMRDWAENVQNANAELLNEGLIAQLYPDDEALVACYQLGKDLV